MKLLLALNAGHGSWHYGSIDLAHAYFGHAHTVHPCLFNPTYLYQYSSFLLAQIYTALHAQWPKVKQLFKEDARQEARHRGG